MVIHEEGVLCQSRTVHPGTEIKFSTGTCESSGWYAAIIAVLRRLIMERNDVAHDGCTSMRKACFNMLNVDKKKAIVFMTSLKKFHMTQVSAHYKKRMAAPGGRVLDDYITDCAALIKRMFVKESASRIEKARRRFRSPIEGDRCFKYLRTANDGTVLRYCTECRDVDCPINRTMARFMARTAKFVTDYNAIRGSRLVLRDFFLKDEIELFTRKFLENNKPITALGDHGEGVIGIQDQITCPYANVHRFRYLFTNNNLLF